VKEDIVDFKPKSITHLEAASIPLAGLTAWTALVKTAEIHSGQRVLIHAAAGGVGSLAVQIAKAKGCHVIGTASEKNIGFVLNLGADEVIDYRNQDFSLLVKDVDVVFDTIGGTTLDKSWQVLKKGGILVSIAGQPDPETAKQYNVRCSSVFVQPDASFLEHLRQLIDTGNLRPIVGSVFKLEDIKQAQDLSQSGRARGKIVIKIV
jgi:NADPH:quinone reductase-like Zn-dependent oxidoreductase